MTGNSEVVLLSESQHDDSLVRNRHWLPSHDVQFYQRDEALVDTVARFLVEGARRSQPILVIATETHRHAFADRMRSLGFDPGGLAEGRDALWLDAAETLSAFMEGGRPNRELFDATVGSVLERLVAGRRYVVVRAFGEMVDLLWRDDKAQAAINVEELWNELASRYSFALVCGYSAEYVRKHDDGTAMERICEQHARVLLRSPLDYGVTE